MATKTTNVQLNIIEDTDPVSQDLINDNSEIIDTELAKARQTNADLADIETKVDTVQSDIEALTTRVTNNANNISKLATDKENKANKGQPDGYASLDSDGHVPVSQLPSGIKEMRVVADIAARNAITDTYEGLRVHVLDATGDSTVTSGWAEYVYDAANSSWSKVAEKESMDIVLDWSNLKNIPDVVKKLNADESGQLLYNGSPIYTDIRSVNFIGGDSEIIYDWSGKIFAIKINSTDPPASDLLFSVETQTKADYVAKADHWVLVGGVQFTLPAGEVYKEFPIDNVAISAGDVIRASTVGDDTGVTFKVLIKNN